MTDQTTTAAPLTEQQHFEKLAAENWERVETSVGFTGYVGPYWRREDEQGQVMGLVVEERHANFHLGTMHGGAVMTFADIALGSAVSRVLGERRMACVTVSLNTQLLSVAKMGDLVTVRPEIVRQTRTLIFIRGIIMAGDKPIASCEGIWKILDGDVRRSS